MKFISTRGQSPAVSFRRALAQGSRPMAACTCRRPGPSFRSRLRWRDARLPEWPRSCCGRSSRRSDRGEIGDVVRDAFNFPAPLVPVAHEGKLSVLELFHGPTAAFKDFGARFLAASLSRIRKDASGKPLNILVATSGDTGGAVAAAFHGRPGIVVSVLFPKGLVSPTQERQLTCWGDNVLSYRVAGTFDDCQRLVKEAFVDAALRQRFELSSANSINLGRLLPQAVYYAATSLAVHRAHGVAPNFLIPSGNLGNSVACVWARKIGLPIGRIVLAHNANRPCRISWRAASGSRAPAFRRWLPPWTSARLATWNGCVHCFRTSTACAVPYARKA
jgi:threonine synthase